MTFRDVLGAVWRRLYVVLAVVVAFAVLYQSLARDGGSYYTHSTVTFTLPLRSTLLPGSGTTDASVIAFAGSVASELNGGRPVLSYSTLDAPYYGAGIREGVVVGLRNDGNQWMSIFPSATIDIRIVGRTKEWVAERQSALLDEVLGIAEGQQVAASTAPEDRITATVGPLSTEISQVSPSRTEQMMALAAMMLAALIVGVSGAIGLDRLLRTPKRRSLRRGLATASSPQRGSTIS